jgi:uncharacterized protein YjiS (DUF1127 family)
MAYIPAARNFGRSRIGWIHAIVHHLNVWRQRRHLSHLDDSALNDIGLTRKEADAEASRPIWDAPQTWRC